MKSVSEQVKYWIGHCIRMAAEELDQRAVACVGQAAELRALAPEPDPQDQSRDE